MLPKIKQHHQNMKAGVHQDKIAHGDGSLTVVEEVVSLNLIIGFLGQ